MKLALVADELNKRMEEIVETMKIVNIRVAVASGKSRILPDRPGPSTRLTIVAYDFSAENAGLQAIVSNQAKKLEDIAEAFLAVTARQAFMAERAPNLDLKSRLCDCKVPVRQTIVPLGLGTKRVFLECRRWEYGVGCRYCEWFMTGRKVHGGLLLSGSLSDQVVVELTAENARLRALISSQAKQLEDAAHASSATSVHPPASEGCDPPNKNETS
ncbi:hypothetical protein LINGRAHAP2_LOCUS36763 [Linum grandiflorum]